MLLQLLNLILRGSIRILFGYSRLYNLILLEIIIVIISDAIIFFIKKADTCFRPLITNNKNQIWKLKRENPPENIDSISLNISLNKPPVAYFSYS